MPALACVRSVIFIQLYATRMDHDSCCTLFIGSDSRSLQANPRKSIQRKHPRASSVKWLWKERATEAMLAFLGSTRVGCITTRRRPPEEGCEGGGSGGEGEEDGLGPPQM